MRYDQDHQSRDIDDRRGQTSVGGSGLGLVLRLLLRTRYGWIVVLLIIGFVVVRQLGFLGGHATQTGGGGTTLAAGDTDAHFVAFVLDDAQAFWDKELPRQGSAYRHATLVLFTDSTPTRCGTGDAAAGPFYCPSDEHVYIDLGFFGVLSRQLGAGGQFARAYVIAHELGHHVQKVLGISEHEGKSHAKGASGASVRLELQADCYAGIWARSANARNLLEAGDLESALNAASRIGDDTLQKEERGRVRPETFTHGTAEQRHRWLKRGYDSGALKDCDTFAAPAL
jgi:predicted metalloprotease